MTKDIEREALIAEIDHFINEAKKSYIVERWAVTYENSNPFSHTINDKNEVWWMKTQARQLWDFWQAAKVNELQDRVDTALALIDTSSYAEIERRLPDFIDQLKEALRGQNDSR